MKILKKIFGFKFTVYVWAIAIAILVFIGAYFLGVSNSNSKGNQATESYSMVKYIEKVNQVVFLNVGIQTSKKCLVGKFHILRKKQSLF